MIFIASVLIICIVSYCCGHGLQIRAIGMALSAEPRFSLAEYTYPIKGPVYLDKTTELREYKRENNNGYISSQKLDGKPKNVGRDVLKELEEFGLILK